MPLTEYPAGRAFPGVVGRIEYDGSGDGVVDHAAEIRIALARQ